MSIEGDVSANPGPVDNSPLFKNDPEEPSELREHMIDELDFVLVPDEAWQLLVDEFNITPGQEPIARKVKIIIMFCNLIELKVPLSISYFMYFNNSYEWDVLNFFV